MSFMARGSCLTMSNVEFFPKLRNMKRSWLGGPCIVTVRY